MTEKSFLHELILNEIKGKNAAIHAYDRMSWTVRSGFLTLFFAAWGLVLGGMVKEHRTPAEMLPITSALLVVSVGLALGGLTIDMGYVVRKFKVISALNNLLKLLVDSGGNSEALLAADVRLSLGHLLRVSGDSKGGDLEKGWRVAAGLGTVIYILPLLVTASGLSLNGFLH